MTEKLSKETLQELDKLMLQLTDNNPDQRQAAMSRLMEYERSGQLPLRTLLDMADEADPTQSMYAITALGRSGEPRAVKKLLQLLETHREGNSMMVETIVDALGETGDHSAVTPLLELLGIRGGGIKDKLKRLVKKERGSENDAATESMRSYLTLPVVRSLDKLADPKAAQLLGAFLEHEDPLVRWHTIQIMVKTGHTAHNAHLQHMAENDPHPMVREVAQIAVDKLAPLPPHLNN